MVPYYPAAAKSSGGFPHVTSGREKVKAATGAPASQRTTELDRHWPGVERQHFVRVAGMLLILASLLRGAPPARHCACAHTLAEAAKVTAFPYHFTR